MYNETMQYILQPFGVAAVELERCQVADEAISAFRVRQAWRKEAFESLRQLVPETTLNYLLSAEGRELQQKMVNYQRRH